VGKNRQRNTSTKKVNCKVSVTLLTIYVMNTISTSYVCFMCLQCVHISGISKCVCLVFCFVLERMYVMLWFVANCEYILVIIVRTYIVCMCVCVRVCVCVCVCVYVSHILYRPLLSVVSKQVKIGSLYMVHNHPLPFESGKRKKNKRGKQGFTELAVSNSNTANNPISNDNPIASAASSNTNPINVLNQKRILTKKSHRRRIKSPNPLAVLRTHFARSPKPKTEQIRALSQATGLSYEEFSRWFRNERFRKSANEQHHKLIRNGSANEQNATSTSVVTTSSASSSESKISNSQTSKLSMVSDDKSNDKEQEKMEMMKPWRNTVKFRRMRNRWVEVFSKFPCGSRAREEMMKELVRNSNKSDRTKLLHMIRPRGPYRASSDPRVSQATHQERSRECWVELQRRFGADKQSKDRVHPQVMIDSYAQSVLNLDADMFEGLKRMFSSHRDYLYVVAKALDVTETLKCEVDAEVKKEMKLLKDDQRRQKRRALGSFPLPPPPKRQRIVSQQNATSTSVVTTSSASSSESKISNSQTSKLSMVSDDKSKDKEQEKMEMMQPWRNTAQFRRMRNRWVEVFTKFPNGSKAREEMMKELVRNSNKSDCTKLLHMIRPRGPYRASSDPRVSQATHQERSQACWVELRGKWVRIY